MSLNDFFEASLVKTVRQIFPYKPYKVGDCACKARAKQELRCRDEDFVVERGKCFDGSEFLVCSQIDPNVCPVLGGIQGSPSIPEPDDVLSPTVNDQESPLVTCIYPPALLDAENVIEDYQEVFGTDEEFALLLEQVCFRTTTDCPIDPLTGEKMPLCSRFVSPNQTGEACRQAALLPGNEIEYERRMEEYCRNETTPDCRCITRQNTLVYDALKTTSNDDDGCWWRWCADNTRFLVPPQIVQATDPAVCAVVRQNIARKINANVATLECCQLQENVIYAPDGDTDLPINCFFQDAVTVGETWFEQYGWWIFAGIILFVIVIAVLCIWGVGVSVKRAPTC